MIHIFTFQWSTFLFSTNQQPSSESRHSHRLLMTVSGSDAALELRVTDLLIAFETILIYFSFSVWGQHVGIRDKTVSGPFCLQITAAVKVPHKLVLLYQLLFITLDFFLDLISIFHESRVPPSLPNTDLVYLFYISLCDLINRDCKKEKTESSPSDDNTPPRRV